MSEQLRVPRAQYERIRKIRERLLKGPATMDGQGWKNGVLYLDTWIVPELDRLIAWCEQKPMAKDDDAYSGGVMRHPKNNGRIAE